MTTGPQAPSHLSIHDFPPTQTTFRQHQQWPTKSCEGTTDNLQTMISSTTILSTANPLSSTPTHTTTPTHPESTETRAKGTPGTKAKIPSYQPNKPEHQHTTTPKPRRQSPSHPRPDPAETPTRPPPPNLPLHPADARAVRAPRPQIHNAASTAQTTSPITTPSRPMSASRRSRSRR